MTETMEIDMSNKVFIGWDSREVDAAETCSWSLTKNSSIPLDVYFLKIGNLRRFCDYNEDPARGASTEFSYSRFLVPYLCQYQGIALFMDCDMLVFGDVAEVFNLDMEGLTIRCTQHDFSPTTEVKMYGTAQVAYPRKLWSSFMLMDCSKLTCWTKDLVETAPGSRLHQFQDVPDDQIGEIPLEWNEVYNLSPETQNFHWTEFNPWHNELQSRYANVWFKAAYQCFRDQCKK